MVIGPAGWARMNRPRIDGGAIEEGGESVHLDICLPRVFDLDLAAPLANELTRIRQCRLPRNRHARRPRRPRSRCHGHTWLRRKHAGRRTRGRGHLRITHRHAHPKRGDIEARLHVLNIGRSGRISIDGICRKNGELRWRIAHRTGECGSFDDKLRHENPFYVSDARRQDASPKVTPTTIRALLQRFASNRRRGSRCGDAESAC
jgi:hypothetical protein